MRLPFLPVLLLILGLAGCTADEAGKTYTYAPLKTPGGRLCTGQCQEAQGFCQETCTLNVRSCTNQVQAQALRDYDQYTRAQFFRHEPIELRPRDFERMQTCTESKDSCYALCESHQRTCYENCGGQVTVNSSCKFLCF